MDLENYWQENKKALIAIGCGLLVFLIANMVVNGTVGRDLNDAKRERAQTPFRRSAQAARRSWR